MHDIYIASIYVFIPLPGLTCQYRKDFASMKNHIDMPRYMHFVQAHCGYAPLPFSHKFFFERTDSTSQMVHLKSYLLFFSATGNNADGHYYLAIGTTVDKVFEETEVTESSLCTAEDVLSLKRCFYKENPDGFFYPSKEPTIFFRCWMKDILNQITTGTKGTCPEHHYVVDIQKTMIETLPTNKRELDVAFNNAYHKDRILDEKNWDLKYNPFIYGLLFGNDNYGRVPHKQIEKTLKSGFSNNITERIYGGNGTIVFLRTHFAFSRINSNPLHIARGEASQRVVVSQSLLDIHAIFDICSVMDAKWQLIEIQQSYTLGDASNIKEALSKMTSYINNSLFHLCELDEKMRYLYEVLDVNHRFEQVQKTGNLYSEVLALRQNQWTNRWILILTFATSLIGIIQIAISLDIIVLGDCLSPEEKIRLPCPTICQTACIILLAILLYLGFRWCRRNGIEWVTSKLANLFNRIEEIRKQ